MLQCGEVVAAKPPGQARRRTRATPAKPAAGSMRVAGPGTRAAVKLKPWIGTPLSRPGTRWSLQA
jgi:hypothetical protein